MPFYAVRRGRRTGLFRTWHQVAPLVDKYSCSECKRFARIEDALDYLRRESEEERFNKLPPDTLRVTVDGSFNRVQGRVGWAFVVTRGDDRTRLHQASGFLDEPRALLISNIAGEIEAARQGILYAMEVLEQNVIVVQYDYEGIRHWITGHWNPGNERVMSYWNQVSQYYQAGRIVFRHVNSHGHWANKIADQLARKACGLRSERGSRGSGNRRSFSQAECNACQRGSQQGTDRFGNKSVRRKKHNTCRLQVQNGGRLLCDTVRKKKSAGGSKPRIRSNGQPYNLFGQVNQAWPREVNLKKSLFWTAIAFVMVVLVAAAPSCSRCRYALRGIKKTQQRIERTRDTLANCESELKPENTYCEQLRVKLFKLKEKYGVYMLRKDRYCK